MIPNPPTQIVSAGRNLSTSVPPSILKKKDYSDICPTYNQLVKSGRISCSVSLSDSIEQLNIASNSHSARADQKQIEGSVHWGTLNDLSGVQTPNHSHQRESVIVTAPPSLCKQSGSNSCSLFPPRRPQSLPDISRVSKPSVEQLFWDIPTFTSKLDRHSRKLSSTNPFLLASNKIPIVSTPSSSFSSVFDAFEMSDPSKQQQDHQEIIHTRRLLDRELSEFTEDDVCASRLPVLERDLSDIKMNTRILLINLSIIMLGTLMKVHFTKSGRKR